MTATCTLCGDVLTVRDCMDLDPLRDRKTVMAIAAAMCQHIGMRHSSEDQTVVDRASNFPPTKPNNILTLIEAAAAMGTLLTALSYVQSEDLSFKDQTEKMKDLLTKAIAQKEVKPLVS